MSENIIKQAVSQQSGSSVATTKSVPTDSVATQTVGQAQGANRGETSHIVGQSFVKTSAQAKSSTPDTGKGVVPQSNPSKVPKTVQETGAVKTETQLPPASLTPATPKGAAPGAAQQAHSSNGASASSTGVAGQSSASVKTSAQGKASGHGSCKPIVSAGDTSKVANTASAAASAKSEAKPAATPKSSSAPLDSFQVEQPLSGTAPLISASTQALKQQNPVSEVAEADSLPPIPNTFKGLTIRLEVCKQKVEFFCRPHGLPLRLLCVFVFLPSLFVFIYLALFASHMYLAETRFAIRGQNQQQSFDMLSTFFRTATSTLCDSYIVQNYIESMDMVDKVEAKLHIVEHYSDKANDIWFRLTRNPTKDELLDYWNWAVTSSFDPDTSIMTVEVKAFSPQMAKDICQAILDFSEDLVNAMNDRARKDSISLAQVEVDRAEQRIRAAQEAMRQYRERTVILDPQAVATGLYGLVNQLEGEITKTTAELAEAMTYMQSDSPRVIMLQNRLEVLQKQLRVEKARLASEMQGDRPLSSLVSEFQSLTLEEEFAQKQLTSAMASLETARVQAESKTLYVESFQKPMVPDESLYPRPVVFALIFMLASAVLLGLVSLVVAAIREHAGF